MVEVLVAMAILAFMMIAVLEMFTLSLLTNFGSAARTQMTFKAQQVVENLRYAQQTFTNVGAAPSGSATFPLVVGTYNIPYLSSNGTTNTNGGNWAYWGPNGADVMEQDQGPYSISYTVADLGALAWSITVTATPVTLTGSTKFMGNANTKRIEYVAQLAKPLP